MPPTPSSTETALRILVVGGGVAGLACAHKLAHDSRWATSVITLVEQKDRYGGRVKTIAHRDVTDDGWYEAGASRVAASHTRVRRLARRVGCTELALPETYDHHKKQRSLHDRFRALHDAFVATHGGKNGNADRALKTLTWHDLMTMQCATFAERDHLAREWGFQSVLREMNAYDFWHYAMPQYTDTAYYTFRGGIQTLPDGLRRDLDAHPRVTLRDSTRVLGVRRATRGTLEVTLQPDEVASVLPVLVGPHATAPPNKGQTTETYDVVFLALPAEALVALEGLPQRHHHLWNAVSRNRLIRCYAQYPSAIETGGVTRGATGGGRSTAKTKARAAKRGTRRRARSSADFARPGLHETSLHKCTTTHAPRWAQLAYCDHTHADHLVRLLRLDDGGDAFRRVVRGALGPQWGDYADEAFDVHYWKHGTHSWKPSLCADDHYERCVHPDAKTPLFVVGASLSHYGHWMEGALETVDDACKRCRRWVHEWLGIGAPRRPSRRSLTTASAATAPAAVYLHHACDQPTRTFAMSEVRARQLVVLDGYVYDVKKIVPRHPGGSQLLARFLGQDISGIYHRVGHSGAARAWLEGSCVGAVARRHNSSSCHNPPSLA